MVEVQIELIHLVAYDRKRVAASDGKLVGMEGEGRGGEGEAKWMSV